MKESLKSGNKLLDKSMSDEQNSRTLPLVVLIAASLEFTEVSVIKLSIYTSDHYPRTGLIRCFQRLRSYYQISNIIAANFIAMYSGTLSRVLPQTNWDDVFVASYIMYFRT